MAKTKQQKTDALTQFKKDSDASQAVIFAVQNKLPENLYNVGTGSDITIKDLAKMIQTVTNHQGKIVWDDSKPDGTPRKWMDVSRMNTLGWKATIDLEEGIKRTYDWYVQQLS